MSLFELNKQPRGGGKRKRPGGIGDDGRERAVVVEKQYGRGWDGDVVGGHTSDASDGTRESRNVRAQTWTASGRTVRLRRCIRRSRSSRGISSASLSVATMPRWSNGFTCSASGIR